LAEVATGSQITLRKYYTENEEVIYRPKCFISINARTPHFKRDDVMDRLLPFKVKRFQNFVGEEYLTPQLLEARDLIWSDMIDQLNPIVDYLLHHDDQDFKSKFRMADFANFGWKLARAQSPDRPAEAGDEWGEIIDKLGQAQTEELLSDNAIFMCLEHWLEDESNHGRPLPTSNLFQELSDISETYSIGLPYKSARSFGRQMVQLRSNLETYYQISVTSHRNKTAYAFLPKEVTAVQ